MFFRRVAPGAALAQGPRKGSAGGTVRRVACCDVAEFPTVATFTDANPQARLSDFNASIDWGDGSDLDTTATIMPDQHHGFLVLGSHTYDQADTFTITITITDLGGSLATATATALVTDGPGYLSSGTHQPNAPIAITFTASARAAILTKPAQPPDAKRDQAVIQVNGRFPAEMVTYMTSAPALPDLRSDGLEGLPYVDLLPALGDHSGPMMDSFFSREDWYV